MTTQENGEIKTKKIKKAPGFYKKALTEVQLEKKYLRYIEQQGDKKFIRSCYIADEEGFVIRRDLETAEVKRLKLLKKAIKKNRQFAVKILPLTITAAIVAGAVFFFTILANPLLQKALETGLETVFEARVNANNFRISLLRFEIGMSSLTIADRDRPMKNLIQFSTMRIKLLPQALLRGKVYIEEIRADSIRFGTDRTVSGALPNRPPREEIPKEPVTAVPLVDLANFDPAALLDQEYDKLQSPRLYDEAMEAYQTAAAKWRDEPAAARARVTELQTRAQPLLGINVNDYRTLDAATLEQIRNTISEVNALVNTVQAAQDDLSRMMSGIQDDVNSARTLEQNARNAFTADFNHLRSYLDLGGGAAMEVLEPVIMGILTDSAEVYLSYGMRALEVLEKVRAMQAQLPKSSPKPKEARFNGRDVPFPTRQYPRFFIGVLATDLLTPADWHWVFDLRGVSSDPDFSGVPTSLLLSLTETGDALQRSGAFRGQADFRSNASERFNADLSAGGFPVSIGLSQLGIGAISGGASFALSASGNTSGGFSGGGNISLVQASLTNPSNTFAQAADEAIQRVNSVDLGLRYEHVVSGRDRFSVSTNFGDILMDALRRIANQYIRQAEQALERALREKIAQHIDGKFVDSEELDMIFSAVRGDMSAVNGLRSSLDQKRSELENRMRSAAEDAARQVADEAVQQGQQAVQDALQGRTPSLPSNPFRR